MATVRSLGLHGLLQPGASAMIALGTHSAGAPGAADQAARSIRAMSPAEWELAGRWARRERAEGVLHRSLAAVAFTSGASATRGASVAQAAPEARGAAAVSDASPTAGAPVAPVAVVPAAQLDRWARLAMVADFRQERLRASLTDALQVLESAGVPRMLLKGSALAIAHYAGGFPERPMEDLDILVPSETAVEAHRAMLRAGWKSDGEAGAEAKPSSDRYASPETGSGLRESARVKHHHLPALRHPATGHIVELHRSILTANNPFTWSDRDVWQAAEERSVPGPGSAAGATALIPRPEDLLLHAAVHLSWAHELRIGLWGWLRDISVLARLVSWPLVVELARARGIASAVYWPLRLGVELGGAAVDLDACDALRPVSAGRAQVLARHYAQGAVPPRSVPGGVRLSRLGWRLGIAPAGSGVGAARPWLPAEGSELSGSGGSAGRRSDSWGVVARELRSLPVWFRWAGRLIRG